MKNETKSERNLIDEVHEENVMIYKKYNNDEDNTDDIYDSYSYIEMDINTEEKTIKFNSKNDKIGILNREINPKNIEGDNMKVSYNSNYFLEGISNIDNENIELLLTESNRPLFIKNPKDESFVYLLMPLNK